MNFNHRADCPRNPDRIQPRRGRKGDDLLMCLDCRYFRVIDPPGATPAPPETPAKLPEPPRPPAPKYVCRTHTDQAVTWNGKGCKPCRRAKTRPPRPTARRQPDTNAATEEAH